MSKNLLVATFDNERDILDAVRASKTAHLKIVDAYTPYPVHGLEHAMGLGRSRITWACFLFGLLGVIVALGFQHWASAVDWPINVGGKPWNSLPAFAPVAFEVMILFGGVGTFLTFLAVCRLFPGKKPSLLLPEATDHRFFLVVEEIDSAFDARDIRNLFEPFGLSAFEERQVEDAS